MIFFIFDFWSRQSCGFSFCFVKFLFPPLWPPQSPPSVGGVPAGEGFLKRGDGGQGAATHDGAVDGLEVMIQDNGLDPHRRWSMLILRRPRSGRFDPPRRGLLGMPPAAFSGHLPLPLQRVVGRCRQVNSGRELSWSRTAQAAVAAIFGRQAYSPPLQEQSPSQSRSPK